MKLFLFVLTFLFTVFQVKSQTSILGNAGGSLNYLGWDVNQTFPLTIKHEAPMQPINFYTNAGAGSLLNLRMFIEPNGNIGVGNFTPANTLFHIHQSNDGPVNFQLTDNITGQSNSDGFEIEFDHANNSELLFSHNEQTPFDIFTAGTDGNMFRRMRLYMTDTVASIQWQKTRVAITTTGLGWDNGPSTTPVMPAAILHVGDATQVDNTRATGYRTWMDYGTFTGAGTDNLYVGFKNEDPTNPPGTLITDFADAVISWGDNCDNPDDLNDLRFILTTRDAAQSQAPPKSMDWHGLEVARFTPTADFGVGNFYDFAPNPIPPARRVEILDMGRELPQFRLTFEQDGFASDARWTDFESTRLGDLYINPKRGGNNRRVGINIQSPLATLDVRGINAGTLPQLRLTQTAGANPVFTDFQTTTIGNLYINPMNNGTPKNVGINTSIPGNTLEINSNAANATGTGNSGLRFSDLNSTSTGYGFNTSGRVLTVDVFGDVVLVDDNTTSTGGIAFCPAGSPTNYLMKYTGTASACTSGVYETTGGLLGIGTTSPLAKTTIVSTNSTDLKAFKTTSNYNNSLGVNYFENIIPSSTTYINQTNVYALTESQTTTGAHVLLGGFFESYDQSVGAITTVGAKGFASSETNLDRDLHNIAGIWGQAVAKKSNQWVKGGSFDATGAGEEHTGVLGTAGGTAGINIGVHGHASGAANDNYGVLGHARNATGTNYGVYGTAPNGTTTSTNAAGYFNGNCYSAGAFIGSDFNLKLNINPLQDASNLLAQFLPKTFEFNLSAFPGMNLPAALQYGLIAQEVEQIIPQMVRTFKSPETYDNAGNLISNAVTFKAVNYDMLIPILTAAVQEQQERIDSLITALNGTPRPDSGSNIQDRNSLQIELKDISTIILNQNDPNPFNESTRITFSIPGEIVSARMLFTNSSGAVINSLDIEERGVSELQVFASDLSSGIYTYTLICDGKVFDSKKMMKQ